MSEALTVLSWMEHLQDEEQPPRHIWWSDKLTGEWFRNVKRKRNKKTGGSSYDEADDVPMMQNDMIDRSGPVPVIKVPD